MQHFQMRRAALSILLAGATTTALAQSTCGEAAAQLQQYVGQVNMLANAEYQSIPPRCGINVACQQFLLNRLNAWYMQQAQQANMYYSRLSAQCASNQGGGTRRRIGVNSPSTDDAGGLDEGAVSELQMDDEDKGVTIKIPANPRGFR